MNDVLTKWWNENWLKIQTFENDIRQEIHSVLEEYGQDKAQKLLNNQFSKVLQKWAILLKDRNLSMSNGLDSQLSYVGDMSDLSDVHSKKGKIKNDKGNWSRVVFNKNKIPNPPPKND
jgi:hypothetical protein